MKAWLWMLFIVPLSLFGVLAAESTCSAAAANLVVMATNPNTAPTNGGTQFLLGLQVTGTADPSFLGSNTISFSGNVGNATPTAAGSYYTAGKALFQAEADAANGIGGYLRTNDSYFASPWKTLLASPSGAGESAGAMFIDAGAYGPTGPYYVPGNGTYAFAYVNVTNSPTGFVDIQGEFAIDTEYAPIGLEGGGVRLTLDGQLQALIPLLGDYNANGAVDAADYVLWRNGGPLQNDPTAGVQPADYDFWRSRFGATSGAGAKVGTSPAAIPEPSSIGLLAIAIWCRCQCGGWHGACGNS